MSVWQSGPPFACKMQPGCKTDPKAMVCTWAWLAKRKEMCEVKLGISSGCLSTNRGHYWGAWIFIVLTGKLILGCSLPLRWLACQSPTNEGLDQVGRQNGKVKKNPLHPMLRASQFAKPNFLKVTLNSNPSSLIPGSNTGFWFLLQRWRLEKALLLGNTWKAISNRW